MLQFQNNYGPMDPPRTADGRMGGRNQMDWSGEISGVPEDRMMPRTGEISGVPEDQMMMPRTGGGTRMMPTVPPMTPRNTLDTRPGMPGGQQAPRESPQLHMQNNLPMEVIEAPTTLAEAQLGSLRTLLARNVGNYVVATFLVGTQSTTSWEGVLYDVGNNYVTIYQEGRDRYIVTDLFSLKFIEFYDVERRRLCNALLGEDGWRTTMD